MESHRYDMDDGNAIIIYRSDDLLEIRGELFGSDMDFFGGSPADCWKEYIEQVIVSLRNYTEKLNDVVSKYI